MSIENVNIPTTLNKIDPTAAAEKKEGDVNYWQRKADEARARHDYQEYEHAIKMLEGKPPESPFQVKGSIDLGSYNPQQAAKEAQDRMDQALQAKDEKIDAERQRAEEAERKLNEEKLEGIRRDFTNQMAQLNSTIEKMMKGNGQDTNTLSQQFMEQYKSAIEIATTLGLEKTSSGKDPILELEIKKLEFQQADKDREFKWKMHEDEKNWELEKMKMHDEHLYRQSQLNLQEKRDDMFANFPQIIGAAFAKGITTGENPLSSPVSEVTQIPKTYHIEIGEGESDTFQCPHCKSPIAVGPTSTDAQCVSCNNKFPIKRMPKTQAPIKGQEG